VQQSLEDVQYGVRAKARLKKPVGQENELVSQSLQHFCQLALQQATTKAARVMPVLSCIYANHYALSHSGNQAPCPACSAALVS
jgi:hypothetical protein